MQKKWRNDDASVDLEAPYTFGQTQIDQIDQKSNQNLLIGINKDINDDGVNHPCANEAICLPGVAV